MVSVCIIDDGVMIEKLESELLLDLEVTSNGELGHRQSTEVTDNSHGTGCAQIITRYYLEVKFTSIKLDKPKGISSNKNHFLTALNHCIDKSFDVIHMSIGSTSFSDFIDIIKAVDKLVDSGKIIIAACNNKNIYTVPACLPNVIGVCTSKDMRDGEYEVNSHNCDGIDFIASSRHWVDNHYTALSNSYAAPFITAKVCEILNQNENIDINKVRKILSENAQNYSGNSDLVRREELITNNPSKLDQYYNTVIELKSINNPVVCLHDIPEKDMLYMKKLFEDKGYSCLLVTNRLQKDFFKMEYINFSNHKIIREATESLNTFYNPDLVILGVFDQPDLNINKYINTDIIYKKEGSAGLHNDIMYINHYPSIETLFNEIFEILGGPGD